MANLEVITIEVDISTLESEQFTTTSMISQTAISTDVAIAGPQGEPGPQGEAGEAASLAVGTVTTGAPGSSASVTNSGSSSVAVLDFTVPKGPIGATGPTGATAPAATFTVSGSVKQREYNMLDYGCAIDGVTDDSSRLQTLINVAYLTGGHILHPGGTCFISTSVQHKTGVAVVGMGPTTSLFTTSMSPGSEGGIFNINNQKAIAFGGLGFSCGGSSTAITSYGHDGLVVENCYLTGTTTANGIINLDGANASSTFQNTFITANRFYAIPNTFRTINLYPRDGYTVTSTVVTGNTFISTSGPAVYCDAYSSLQGLTVANNSFMNIISGPEYYNPGVAVLGGLASPCEISNVVISGNNYVNTLTTNTNQGFAWIYTGDNVVISGNTMTGAWTPTQTTQGPAIAPGRIDNPITNLSITNNTIKGFDAAWDADSMRNVEVANNLVDSCGQPFILGYNIQDKVHIHHNTHYNSIHSTYTAGIYFANANPAIKCEVTDNIFVDDRPMQPPQALRNTVQAGGSLSASTTYYYEVTALDGSGQTLGSAQTSALTTSANKQVYLQWNSVAGALSYNIYRSTTSGSYASPSLLTNVTSADFTDSGTLTLQAQAIPSTSTVHAAIMQYAVELTGNCNFGDVILRGNRFYLPNSTFTSFYKYQDGGETAPMTANTNEYHDSTGRYWDNEFVNWNVDSQSNNGVQRVRSSTGNFLSNAAFGWWDAGTSAAPSGWTFDGDASISQSATTSIGSYAAQIAFNTANTGELWQAVNTSTEVDYTFSCYVQRTSGTGAARLVAQLNSSPYTEFASVNLSTTPGWQLALLTVKPSAGTQLRFSIKSGGTVASTWLVSECMFQESKAVATTFQYAAIDDTSTQNIYGNKNFGYASFYAMQLATGASLGYVMTSDASGNFSWQAAPSGSPTGAAGGDLAGSYPSPIIATNAVTNAKAAQMPASTFKGNNTGATANPADLTVSQAKALLALTEADVSSLTTDLAATEKTANKGIANGYASLDASGKLPVGQFPSGVDPVEEYSTYSAFPATGSSGIIYVAQDTELLWRWTGSTYVQVAAAATVSNATTSSVGLVELAGDLAGTATSPQVTSTHLTAALPVAQGGTGSTSVGAAQTALGLGALATLSSVSLTTNVTGTLPIANGGTGATSAAASRSSLGAAASGANADITSLSGPIMLGGAVATLTDGATIATNAALGNEFTVTIAGNRTMSNPTNPVSGQKLVYRITQDGTGNRTMTWGTAFRFSGGTPPILTTTAGKTDYLGFLYNAASATWDMIAFIGSF